MTRSFSPTDKPRKRKPAPDTPEAFLQTLRSIAAVVEKLEAEEVYKTLTDSGAWHEPEERFREGGRRSRELATGGWVGLVLHRL